jgi:hypothetical protein
MITYRPYLDIEKPTKNTEFAQMQGAGKIPTRGIFFDM